MSARKSLQSALSRGWGYEPTPPGTFFDAHSVSGYFIDFRAKTTATAEARQVTLMPTDLAQIALGWWERTLAGEAGAAQRFSSTCAALEAQGIDDGTELRWPYTIPIEKHHLTAPWLSALAQSQAASAFVRAYLHTADERFAALSLRAIRPILPSSSSGLLVYTPNGPVPEESPSHPPSLILNGWIYALWGLWDVAVGLGDAACRALFEESTACLRRTLDRYDIGWWSLYSLYPHRVPDLAKPFYHRLHVHQLEVMQRLAGGSEFGPTARRWAGYDTAPKRVAAIAQKALFVALA